MRLLYRAREFLMACLVASAGSLMAQEYPSRVVRIVAGDTPGSGSDIFMRLLTQKEMFARTANIRIEHVPHKGTAPAVISLVGGHVAMMLAAVGVVAPHIATGRVRLLATAGPSRISSFPDTPTLVESGYPDVVVIGWIGLLGPHGHPAGYPRQAVS